MTIFGSSILGAPPPPPGAASSCSGGFRLLEPAPDTISVYSACKHKIDSMFCESDSSASSNQVQARIDNMFREVEQDVVPPPPPPPSLPVVPPPPLHQEVAPALGHAFSVDYLGSVPLGGKVSSLQGLQDPLRELYFSYKRKIRGSSMTGKLEISQSGLKVSYQGEQGDLEQLNPFPTIAVWSAVKFVLQQQDSPPSYAFLPLITDPDTLDKRQLFRPLQEMEAKHVMNQPHAPLFAVVMRKMGAHRQLECHGFACQTSEDAIVIAATLYKSLMTHMRAKDKRPRNRNGVSCISVSSSVYTESSAPIRPPRKKRSTRSSSSVMSDKEMKEKDARPKKSTKSRRAPTVPPPPIPKSGKSHDIDEIVPYEEPAEVSSRDGSDLRRTSSLRRTPELLGGDNSGDILTKVTIPRSGSFLNAGGLTRYKSKNRSGPNGQKTGGSPLGFSELFNEFRLQEGLNSMDEILNVIIDSEGMSFNDLKPIYKEFLLKLAVTLTKDELYQRSKSIMRRQKKKIMRRNSTAQNHRRKIIIGAKGLKRVFRKSFHLNIAKKLYNKKPKPQKPLSLSKISAPIKQDSSISTSSYDTRQFRPKHAANVPRKQSHRKRKEEMKEINVRMRRDRMSTSEDSDFFTLKRSKKTSPSQQNRNSSSGYVSCSECSYDSDTCTCVSADKCYCSLGNRGFTGRSRRTATRTEEPCYCQSEIRVQDMSWCGCDTDSCTDSNKCYCPNYTSKGTIFQQLKQRGFIPRSESMMTPPRERRLCKKLSNSRSTRSVEYVANPTDPYRERELERCRERYRPHEYDLLGLRYPRASSELAPKSARYGSVRSFASFNTPSTQHLRRSGRAVQTAVSPVAGETMDALSVKKSAEIAALFADVKLSQTTDITHLGRRRGSLAALPPGGGPGGRMVRNSLYASSGGLPPQKPPPGMYSAKAGLYTIHSQSDSSCSERKRPQDTARDRPPKRVDTLENSLGYLP